VLSNEAEMHDILPSKMMAIFAATVSAFSLERERRMT
jgi:hypothetical protein